MEAIFALIEFGKVIEENSFSFPAQDRLLVNFKPGDAGIINDLTFQIDLVQVDCLGVSPALQNYFRGLGVLITEQGRSHHVHGRRSSRCKHHRTFCFQGL